MKVKIDYKFTEMVIPPRCRKARPQDGKDSVMVNIREVKDDKAPIAFIVSEYGREKCMVRSYNGRLYKQAQDRSPDYHDRKIADPIWVNQKADAYNWQWYVGTTYNGFCSYMSYKSQQSQLDTIKGKAEKYIIVDGYVYERTGEPYYYVTHFGLGCNHGGTGFFIGWADYSNRKTVWGMSPLSKEKAVKRAVERALARGDDKSVDHMGAFYNIEVLMPQVSKKKYAKEY